MSESRPGLFHYTTVGDDGAIRCSCEGFCLQGHCWHVDAIPLCMKVAENDLMTSAPCWLVQGHEGEHSWQKKTTS